VKLLFFWFNALSMLRRIFFFWSVSSQYPIDKNVPVPHLRKVRTSQKGRLADLPAMSEFSDHVEVG
jgi:hypothetical protein